VKNLVFTPEVSEHPSDTMTDDEYTAIFNKLKNDEELMSSNAMRLGAILYLLHNRTISKKYSSKVLVYMISFILGLNESDLIEDKTMEILFQQIDKLKKQVEEKNKAIPT
jgi:hypothetical protein